MAERGGSDSVLRCFLGSEAAGGVLLILAACLALMAANLGFADIYHDLLHAETGPVLNPKLGPMTVHLWINDGLMAAFFLLAGLYPHELRRDQPSFVGALPDRHRPDAKAPANNGRPRRLRPDSK